MENNDLEVAKTKNFVYGFGGWLYFFAASLVFQLFFDSKYFYNNFKALNSPDYAPLFTIGTEYYNALWEPTLVFECFSQVVIIVLILIIGYYCVRFDKRFRTLSLIFLSLSVVLQGIDVLLISIIQNDYDEPLFDNMYDQFSRSIYYAAIWIPYFIFSKRVRNTYIVKADKSVRPLINKDSTARVISGFGTLITILLAFSYYVLGGIIYIWSAVLGYNEYGFIGCIVTLALPVISQIYWLIQEWGTGSPYVTFSLVSICMMVIFTALSSIGGRRE